MKVFLLSFSVLHLFSVVAPSPVSDIPCPGDQIVCLLTQDLSLRELCLLDRESLCGTTQNLSDALNISGLQCTASLRPSFVCCDESETFPLELLCNRTAQCSNNHVSEETTLHCEEILQLPFLISDTGMPIVDLQSSFWNGSLEGPIQISHPAGLPFGSSIQTNFTVSTNGYISFGAALNFSNPTEFPSPTLSYIVAPFWTEFDSDTVGGVQCDEYSESESESVSGSEHIFQEVANFINELKPDLMWFNPAWMIVCRWNNINKIISPQKNTFQGIVITDGVANSFAIFTYQHTCATLLSQRCDEKAPVIIGFQGEVDFFSLYDPSSYRNQTETSRSEPDPRANGSTTDSWCNLVYQLAPKTPHDANISIVKDTRGYFVGQSSTTVCKTDLLFVSIQWFRKGSSMAISNSIELILNISEDDNCTVYCCRATTMQKSQEINFTLIISQSLQPASLSPTHTYTIISEASVTMENSVVSDDPPSWTEFKGELKHNVLTGGVIVGAVLTLVVFLTLVSIYFRRRKHRGRISNKLVYNLNGSRKYAIEHTDEANWITDPETGLIIATLTSRSNPSLSEAQILLNHREKIEVPFSALDLHKKLGDGTFGEIFKGALRNLAYPHRQPKPCIIKLLKSTAPSVQKDALLSQTVLMQYVESHPHVLKLLGCCTTDDRVALIVEYCALGNLREFLARNRRKFQQVSSRRPSNGTLGSWYSRTPFSWSVGLEETCLVEQAASCLNELGLNNGRGRIYSDGWEEEEKEDDMELSLSTLLDFGRQLTLGMEYLAQKRIVHRNLAARNILVSQNWQLKISDFGIYHEGLYGPENEGKIPLRWMSLETILHKQYTTMSDMWSFGVVLWEILTLGTFPFLDSSNSEVLEKLKSGHRMPKPENCPQHLYELMLTCWDEDPLARPSFKRARQHIDQVISSTEEAEEYLHLISEELMNDS